MEASDPLTSLGPARARLLALAEVALCSSVPTQLAIGAMLMAVGWSPLDEAGQLSRNYVITLSLADTALVVALMLWLLREHGENPRTLWLGHPPAVREVGYGLVTTPVLLIGVALLLNTIHLFAPGLRNVASNPLEQLADTPGGAAAFGLVAMLTGGVKEELQRAFLLRRFEQHLGGATVGLIVLSVAFGLGHYVQGWDAVITTGVLGAIWASMYLKRRSSVAPMASHAAFNGLEIVRAALVGR